MRNSSASVSPIRRARRASLRLDLRHDHREEDHVVDAEHDLERGQRQQSGPGFRAPQQFDHFRKDLKRRIKASPNRMYSAIAHSAIWIGEADRKILSQRLQRQRRPQRHQRQIEPAQPRHPNGMDGMKRHEGQHDQRGDQQAAQHRLRLQQEQVERRGVPQRRKAAEMIVVALHALVGEIHRAGDHDADAEQRPDQRQQQPAGGDGIGRHEHIGDEVDHQVEHLAGPVRLQPLDVELARDRPVDAVDQQGDAEPEEHRGPMRAHRLQQRHQREAGAERGEPVHAERGGAQHAGGGGRFGRLKRCHLRACLSGNARPCLSAPHDRVNGLAAEPGLKKPPQASIVGHDRHSPPARPVRRHRDRRRPRRRRRRDRDRHHRRRHRPDRPPCPLRRQPHHRSARRFDRSAGAARRLAALRRQGGGAAGDAAGRRHRSADPRPGSGVSRPRKSGSTRSATISRTAA